MTQPRTVNSMLVAWWPLRGLGQRSATLKRQCVWSKRLLYYDSGCGHYRDPEQVTGLALYPSSLASSATVAARNDST